MDVTPPGDNDSCNPDMGLWGGPKEADVSATVEAPQEPRPHALTREEARAVFNERAQRLLGLDGEEFRRRWEAGELDPDDDRVLRLVMLLPLGR